MTTNEVIKLHKKIEEVREDNTNDLVLSYRSAKGVLIIMKKLNLKYDPLDRHLMFLVNIDFF